MHSVRHFWKLVFFFVRSCNSSSLALFVVSLGRQVDLLIFTAIIHEALRFGIATVVFHMFVNVSVAWHFIELRAALTCAGSQIS